MAIFPCYGNDDDRVDSLAVELTHHFSEELKNANFQYNKNARPTLSHSDHYF